MDPEKEILALRADLNDLRRFTQAIARATGVHVAVPEDATQDPRPEVPICRPDEDLICKCGVRLSDHEQGGVGTRTASLVRAWHRFEMPEYPHPGLPAESTDVVK